MYAETYSIISPKFQTSCEAPGDQLSMSIVLQQQSIKRCPGCYTVLSTVPCREMTGTTWQALSVLSKLVAVTYLYPLAGLLRLDCYYDRGKSRCLLFGQCKGTYRFNAASGFVVEQQMEFSYIREQALRR